MNALNSTSMRGKRLAEFASLLSSWDGEEAKRISSDAPETSQKLLQAMDRALVERPGVFQTVEGGVLGEWTGQARIRSLEIMPDGNFEMFSLEKDQREVNTSKVPRWPVQLSSSRPRQHERLQL